MGIQIQLDYMRWQPSCFCHSNTRLELDKTSVFECPLFGSPLYNYGESVTSNIQCLFLFCLPNMTRTEDSSEQWFPAKVQEIDPEKRQILVHYMHWNSRHDEWVAYNSPRLRSGNSSCTKRQFGTGQLQTKQFRSIHRLNSALLKNFKMHQSSMVGTFCVQERVLYNQPSCAHRRRVVHLNMKKMSVSHPQTTYLFGG